MPRATVVAAVALVHHEETKDMLLDDDDVTVPEGPASRQPRGSYVRSIVVLAGGSAAGQVLVVASTPLVSRIYAPATFGAFSLFYTYVTFTAAVGSLVYNTAIVSARDRGEAATLLWASLLISAPGSAIGGIGMFGLTKLNLLGFGSLPLWTSILASVSIGLTVTYTTFRFWCVREGYFGVVSRSSVLQNVGRVVGQIIGGLIHPGIVTLVLSDSLGRVLGMRRSGLVAFREARESSPALSWSQLVDVLVRYRSFPLFYLPSTLIDNLAVWLPLPLIISRYGASAGGYFAIAAQMVSLPLILVGANVADVFHSAIAGIVREGRRPVSLLWKTTGGLFALGLGPGILVGLFGPQIFTSVLGESWTTAGSIAAAMAPWLVAQLCVSPVSRIVLVCDGQRLKLVYDIVVLVLTVSAFLAAERYGMSLVGLVEFLSAVNVCSYLVYFGLLVHLANRKVGPCAE